MTRALEKKREREREREILEGKDACMLGRAVVKYWEFRVEEAREDTWASQEMDAYRGAGMDGRARGQKERTGRGGVVKDLHSGQQGRQAGQSSQAQLNETIVTSTGFGCKRNSDNTSVVTIEMYLAPDVLKWNNHSNFLSTKLSSVFY
uniref:Uncharacterized protein n=1 Tax=Oryza nivara TaxID=4536 RepID=A0A0E0FFR0_ORYNI